MAKDNSPLALPHLRQLTDHELLTRVQASARGYQQGLAQLLAQLGEVDARGPALLGSHSSLFSFCVERLGFSEGETQNRIISARAARRFPLVLELVASNRLHLTGVRLLAPYLTEPNHRALLEAACGKTARRIKELIAERFPQPDVPSIVRKLPERRRGAGLSNAAAGGDDGGQLGMARPGQLTSSSELASCLGQAGSPVEQATDDATLPSEGEASAALAPQAAPDSTANRSVCPMPLADSSVLCSTVRLKGEHGSNPVGRGVDARPSRAPALECAQASVSALSAARYKVQFTAGGPLRAKMEEAEALCSHAVPPGDLARLFERALDVLIAHEKKRRFAVGVCSSQPKASASGNRSGAAEARGMDTGHRPAIVEIDEAAGFSPAGWRAEVDKTVGSPRAGRRRAPASRYVPARMRRRVWERDGGQCAFVDSEGRRCSERRWLQIEHIEPHALGGQPTLENLELLCHRHNQLRARQIFGPYPAGASRARSPSRGR